MPAKKDAVTDEWPHVSDAVAVRQDDGSWVYLTRPEPVAVEPAPTTEENK